MSFKIYLFCIIFVILDPVPLMAVAPWLHELFEVGKSSRSVEKQVGETILARKQYKSKTNIRIDFNDGT